MVQTTKTEFSGSGFGIGINFGFDWYFTEGISLGGKYTLGYSNRNLLTLPLNAIIWWKLFIIERVQRAGM